MIKNTCCSLEDMPKNTATEIDDYLNAKFAAELVAERNAFEMRRVKAALEYNRLDSLVDKYNLKNFIIHEEWQRPIKELARRFVRMLKTDAWFLAAGQTGAGKTHICTAIVGEFLKIDIPVRYMLWREDISKIKPISNSVEAAQQEMKKLKTAPCLYIDDLFKGEPTAADIKAAFELIDARYRNNLKTIISTERYPSELTGIDAAISGRILEKSKGFIAVIGRDSAKNQRL